MCLRLPSRSFIILFFHLDLCHSIVFHRLLLNISTFQWPQRPGRRSKKPPALPSGFQFDIPFLVAVGNPKPANQVDPDVAAISHDEMPHATPLSEPPTPTNCGKQSADLRVLALQIEQQKLEIKKLELEVQIKAGNAKLPLFKPKTVPLLITVRQSPNAGKSLGQFDYNVRIVAPKNGRIYMPLLAQQKGHSRICLWPNLCMLFRYHACCQQ